MTPVLSYVRERRVAQARPSGAWEDLQTSSLRQFFGAQAITVGVSALTFMMLSVAGLTMLKDFADLMSGYDD